MYHHPALYALLLLLSSAVCVAAAAQVWRRRGVAGAAPLMLLMLTLGGRSLAYAMYWLVMDRQFTFGDRQVWQDLMYVLGLPTATLFLAFVLYQTNRDHWLTRRGLALLCLEPVLTLAVFLSDGWHGLYFAGKRSAETTALLDGGPWFWGHLLYSYLLIGVAIWFLIQTLRHTQKTYRRRAVIILVCTLVPWGSHILGLAGVRPLPGLDLTLIAFTITGALLTYTLFYNHLLDLAPAARSRIFETLPDAVLVLDTGRRIADANPAALSLLREMGDGPVDRVIGEPITRFFEAWPRWEAQDEATMYVPLEVIVHRWGCLVVLERRVSVLRDKQGNQQGWMLYLHDVTERREAEQRVQASEYRYRMLVEQNNDAVFIINLNLVHEKVNARAAEMFGYSIEELEGMTTRQLVSEDEIVTHQNRLQLLLAGERLPRYERWFRRKDGTRLLAEVNVSLVRDAQGNPLHLQSILHDITAQREMETDLRVSEERFRTLIELLPIGVAVHQEGHIRYVNAAAMRILGATTPESILKRPTRDFVHPTSYSLVTDRIDQIRQSGETLRLVEERLIRVDGSAIEVEVASSPLLYEGKPAILAVFSDVAERKQSEQRKIDLALERERRSVLQQFVTDASHDLRTPLAAMQTAGYLIAKLTEKLADQVNKGHSSSPMLAELQTTVQAIQDRVASSRHNTERLRNLIDAMFEMIRLDRTDALDLKPYSLNALAEDVAEAHRPEAAKKGILFSVEPAPTPPLRMNPIELKRAIQELARNAIQFTPSGGRVTLRTCVVGSETAIEVSDTGPGIDPAVLPAIFKRFYRGDLARGTQSGGNGLGLSIAQRIVELHHGRIEVDSHVGQGSTFRLWLPM